VPDPVAWTVVEPGWRVVDVAGEEIGRVHEITGDAAADIFDGLTVVKGHLSKSRYIPSESVGEILEGEVHLTLTGDAVEALPAFIEPAAEEQIIPERSTWYQRLAWWLTGRNR
jgi:Uncharacterized protein conserved in bacteria (DUF2171)